MQNMPAMSAERHAMTKPAIDSLVIGPRFAVLLET
jgi:hypothetical protein